MPTAAEPIEHHEEIDEAKRRRDIGDRLHLLRSQVGSAIARPRLHYCFDCSTGEIETLEKCEMVDWER